MVMSRVHQNNKKINQPFQMSIAVVLFASFIMTFLLSDICATVRMNHEHDLNGIGGNCAVCAHIQNAENLLKQIAIAAKSILSAIVGLISSVALLYVFSSVFESSTLVHLRIRMND